MASLRQLPNGLLVLHCHVTSSFHLIGCPEHSALLFLNLKKAASVLLPTVGVRHSAGLPGMLMMYADAFAASRTAPLRLLASDGQARLRYFLATFRGYAARDNLDLRLSLTTGQEEEDQLSEVQYKDDHLTITHHTLPPRPPGTSTITQHSLRISRAWINDPEMDTASLQGAHAEAFVKDLVADMYKGADPPTKHHPDQAMLDTPYSQLCTGPTRAHWHRPLPPLPPRTHQPVLDVWVYRPAAVRGSLLVEKCTELGILGPMRARLLQEGRLTLESGRVVYDHEVLGPAQPSKVRSLQAAFKAFKEADAEIECRGADVS